MIPSASGTAEAFILILKGILILRSTLETTKPSAATLGLSIHLRGDDGASSELLMGDYATGEPALDGRCLFRRFALRPSNPCVLNPHETVIHKG